MKRIATSLIATLILLFSTAVSADSDATFDELSERIRRIELDNGMRFILMKQDFAPVVACYMKFRAGSVDETDRTSGIAHMLEHMLFKGTRRVGTSDWEREEKYLFVIRRWMEKLDHWRRKEGEARAAGNEAEAEAAHAEVLKWRRRLDALNAMARRFIIREEDSYLYSVNGSRGYNAYTSADLTNYQVQLPANRLEVWARLESDRMQNSVLREFYTERYVVQEERRMRVENVARRSLFEKFGSEIYGDHPYGRPVIGPMNSIRFLNPDMAMEFYRTYYAPNNAVVSIVGDIDFEETEDMLRRYFGPIPARDVPPVTDVAEPQHRRVDVEVRHDGAPLFLMGWFKPAMPHPADLHLELLGEVLAGGQDSRLTEKLTVETRAASRVNVWTSYPGQRLTNLFLIQVYPAPDVPYERVEELALAEIQRVVDEGVQQEELDRARNRLRADFIYRMRSNEFMADNLSYFEIIAGDYREIFEYNERMDAVTVEDLQHVAARYLKANIRMTARLLPEEAEAAEEDSE